MLTQKQIRILELLANGYRYREIQKIVGIASTTLKFHVTQIKATLGCCTKEQAVAIGIKRGLIQVED